MESLLAELSQRLLTRHWKLVTAESCTGGGLAYRCTQLAGSSDWFERGFVTYSNLSKEEMLNVPHALLETYGAVSAETAAAMAVGALENSQAQISVAITGIAGPTGGSAEKPVGTVWFGWASIQHDTVVQKELFSGDRQAIREQAIETAMAGLLRLAGD